MSCRIRFTEEARADIKRLYAFALESSEGDWSYAERVLHTIETSLALLGATPFAGRQADNDPCRRELVMGFGATGYVALYEIEDARTLTVLALRHQREDDYL